MAKLLFASIFSLVIISAIACAPQNQVVNVTNNKANAERWVKDTLPGYTMAGFSTASLDSDNDGYISVDITVTKNGTNDMKFLQLDCPTTGDPNAWQVGQGCKFKQMPYDPKF